LGTTKPKHAEQRLNPNQRLTVALMATPARCGHIRMLCDLMSAMNSIEPQEALVRKFFERRNIQLFEGVRRERGVIAERMAADGLLNSGAFVVAVTAAFMEAFKGFAQGLVKDSLDLVQRSGLAIDDKLASWIKQQLEPLFDVAAKNLCSEAGEGRVLPNELKENVDRAMGKLLAEMQRDLGIELDVALVTQTQPAVVTDEAFLDSLVPLQNRRGLESEFGAQGKDPVEPLCLVLFDIDHFKDVNDKHGGHATGDEALVSIANTALACVRGKGQAFRLGGDEFVLLLPNHMLQEGLAVAERFRCEVNSSPRTARQLTLSVSVGLAQYPDHADDLDALLKAADAALYDAKNRNRNVVRYFGEPEPRTPAPREAERKQPEPGGLSTEEQLKIRQDYFRSHMARCPRDEAVLEVEDVTAMGQSTRSLMVSCPFCGFSAQLD
jgi:diguanylate cyclase (GGDEF)-like protein